MTFNTDNNSDQAFEEQAFFSQSLKTEIFDLIDISVVVIDYSGRIVFTNESWNKHFSHPSGTQVESGQQVNYFEYLIHSGNPELMEEYKAIILKSIDEKKKLPELIIPLSNKSGKSWLNIQVLPLNDQSGYTLILQQDITERKNLEAKKKESELIFKALIENMEDIVFTLGEDFKYNGVFGNWVNKSGKKESDFIGLTAIDILGDEHGKIHETAAKEAFKGNLITYQWEALNVEGKKLHYQTTLSPVKDAEGHIGSLVGLGRDITDLMEERNKAQLSDKLKSTFLSSISHEIRTPLNAILGFSQLMLEHPGLDENLRDYANIIIKRGNDLVNIVDDIMEISMIQAGAIKPEYDEVPVNVLLDSMYEDYSEQLAMSSRNIELRVEKRIFGRKFVIHSDGNILKQIFNKLIDNSVKFTSQGQIRFGYRLNKDDEIVFYVSDSGIGILPEKQKLIFDLFRTADETNTRMHDGLGLGLSIVKELIALLGGEIWFSSIPGKGTDMYFSIPFERIGTSNKQPSATIKNRNLFPGKKILIVEDDPINNYFLKEVLEAAQVEILYAADGKKAMEILETTPDIDLVFLDLNLPYFSGEEILKRLRKSGNYVKVIIQSAFTTDAYNIPPDLYTAFLSKPLKPVEIYGAMQKYL